MLVSNIWKDFRGKKKSLPYDHAFGPDLSELGMYCRSNFAAKPPLAISVVDRSVMAGSGFLQTADPLKKNPDSGPTPCLQLDTAEYPDAHKPVI